MSGFPAVWEFLHNEALRIGFIGSLLISSEGAWALSPILFPAPLSPTVPFIIALTAKGGNEAVLTLTEIVF